MIFTKTFAAFFLGLVTAVAFHVLYPAEVSRNQQLTALTFSSTQSWDPGLEIERDTAPFFVRETPILPPPPSNISTTTVAELEYLHSLVPLRTESTQAEIEAEIMIINQRYDGERLVDVVSRGSHPLSAVLLYDAHEELRGHILRAKAVHNRVRPSYLDPSLTTTIDVPLHPAYPSGHAAESHFFALLLSDLNPEKREQYLRDAARVAHNREIAGVHYPSDTVAGVALAEAYYAALTENELFQVMFAAAKSEWD